MTHTHVPVIDYSLASPGSFVNLRTKNPNEMNRKESSACPEGMEFNSERVERKPWCLLENNDLWQKK